MARLQQVYREKIVPELKKNLSFWVDRDFKQELVTLGLVSTRPGT